MDDIQLAHKIAQEIVDDITDYAERHLSIYKKYTLSGIGETKAVSNSKRPSVAESNPQFFSLITDLRDVSALARRLLELTPILSSKKADGEVVVDSNSGEIGPPAIAHNSKHDLSNPNRATRGEACGSANVRMADDTAQVDLQAVMIESLASDDFLVLSSSLESISARDMIVTALVFIKSHECFTLSHDIQGVSALLKRIKFFILNILAPKDQMELITKLLTSIGRYNEMNYVFDLFRERNQFEVLLGKGVDKTPELRIALLNYVKRHPEFYQLVTLNFSMFLEIAESLEASAKNRLNGVTLPIMNVKIKEDNMLSMQKRSELSAISRRLNGTNIRAGDIQKNVDKKEIESSKGKLDLCITELIDASDCYSKAGCYKRSAGCEKLAKLVALQMALIPDGPNILNVAHSDLNDLILSFWNFNDAYIVAEGYGHNTIWRNILFEHVILGGRLPYLYSFRRRFELSNGLIEELVLLYKQHLSSLKESKDTSKQSVSEKQAMIKNVTEQTSKPMKLILSELSDVELRCKIYSQLNYDDARESLMEDRAVQAHLRDLKLIS